MPFPHVIVAPEQRSGCTWETGRFLLSADLSNDSFIQGATAGNYTSLCFFCIYVWTFNIRRGVRGLGGGSHPGPGPDPHLPGGGFWTNPGVPGTPTKKVKFFFPAL